MGRDTADLTTFFGTSSQLIRIVSWNMNRCFRPNEAEQEWTYLDGLEPTIALVQEAPARAAHTNLAWRNVEGRGDCANARFWNSTSLCDEREGD